MGITTTTTATCDYCTTDCTPPYYGVSVGSSDPMDPRNTSKVACQHCLNTVVLPAVDPSKVQ